MRKKLAIAAAVCALLVAGAVLTYTLLPKRYLTAERLSEATIFWNDKEAFIFLDVSKMGRAQNVLQERMASGRFGLLAALTGFDFNQQELIAYHLADSGALDAPAVPQGATLYGTWSLNNGRLQLTATANRYRNLPGFRWDGKQFEAVPALTVPPSDVGKRTVLTEDDSEDDEYDSSRLLNKKQAKAFRDAGWHWKTISGYEAGGDEAALPISLHSATYNLLVHSSPRERPTQIYLFVGGVSRMELSGGTLAATRVLWESKGWQEIPRSEYERYAQKSVRRSLPWTIWLWLLLALFFMLWKLFAWGHVIYSFATVKRRVLKNVATGYSFPPALPGQFPQLDAAALEHYTAEWESLGFVRLLDTAPISDAKNPPATFCRLLVHTRHHCFAQVMQIFPKGKAPMPMRNGLVSYLEEGWSMGFSDRKPLPGGTLIRRPKALAVNMPESNAAGLLQSLLALRQQICFDLGITPLTDDTLDAYIARAQQTAKDIRSAVGKRNFLTGVPQYYYRKLGLMKTKPEYVWLGDYPKAAEQRKQAHEAAPVG